MNSTAPHNWLERGFISKADVDRKLQTRDATRARVMLPTRSLSRPQRAV
jgi:hypothetical protein